MKNKKSKYSTPRNPAALPAKMRNAGSMKDRREERGGAKNIVSDILKDFDVCPTCGKGPKDNTFCSSSFHCCKECVWVDGVVVSACEEHSDDEEEHECNL